MASSLGTDPQPAFPLPPREGLPHLSPSPLLPPTAAWENSCLPFRTGLSVPSGRRELRAAGAAAGTAAGTAGGTPAPAQGRAPPRAPFSRGWRGKEEEGR